MYKASIIGIDWTGKSTLVRALNEVEGIDTIHLTKYQGKDSGIARFFNNISTRLIQIGEDNHRKTLTGFAYLMQLFPYFFEERAKRDSSCLVSDRDPIIDTLCYSHFYLGDGLANIIRPRLKSVLEYTFNYPDILVYLEGDPGFSASRNTNENQMHEKVLALSKLQELFDKEVCRLEKDRLPVVRIDMNVKSLEEAIDEVKVFLGRS